MNRIGLILLALVLMGAGCAGGTEELNSLTFDFDDSVEEETQSSAEQTAQVASWEFPGVLAAEQIEGKQVRISTEKGDIVFELFADTAPKTVSNFVYLTEGGYYNGLTFHRREEGFVIQGGDPNGNGTGGPGYRFEDELDDAYAYDRGIVAMANAGPNTNGSQFFIMLSDYPLPKSYSIFGRVLEGIEIVDEIVVGDVMTTVTVEDKQ